VKGDNITGNNSLSGEPSLPADFAQRVLQIAHKKLRRRQLRNRVAAALAFVALIAALPLATFLRSGPDSLASLNSTAAATRALDQSSDEALAYQLAQTMSPRSAGDYLLPNAAALKGFDSAYSEASWEYDSRDL
jgi:hypothetical protein